MEKALSVNNLRISFKTQQGILKAIRGINFDLYKGEAPFLIAFKIWTDVLFICFIAGFVAIYYSFLNRTNH